MPGSRPLGARSWTKFIFFQNMAMSHFKLNRMTNLATWKQYFTHRPSPNTEEWCQKVKNALFQNMVILHIKLKGMMIAVTSTSTSKQFVLHSSTPEIEQKVKNLNFAIPQSVLNIFTKFTHANRDTISINHIK